MFIPLTKSKEQTERQSSMKNLHQPRGAHKPQTVTQKSTRNIFPASV
jgi:hypothetical protein